MSWKGQLIIVDFIFSTVPKVWGKKKEVTVNFPLAIMYLIDYFRLFIVATGCPSEAAPRGLLVVTGDSARIQDEITGNSAWFFNVLGV